MADEATSVRASIPRWMAFILLLVGILLGHAVIPWAISLTTHRYGWTDGRPGMLNALGLIPVVAAIAGVTWIVRVGFAETSDRIELALVPRQLLMRGPYEVTRNPLYASELSLWLGWAFWYGSVAVGAGFVVLWAAMHSVVVPWEERSLEARFDETYRAYKSRTPRWFGVPGFY